MAGGSFDTLLVEPGIETIQEWVGDGLNATEKIVKEGLAEHYAKADLFSKSATDAIEKLGALTPSKDVTLESIPTPVKPVKPTIDSTLPDFEVTDYGKLDTGDAAVKPTLATPPSLDDLELDIDDFVSSITSFNIPEAPAIGEPSAPPTKPTLSAIGEVVDPTVVIPVAPDLDEIKFPTFSKLNIPEYEDVGLPPVGDIVAPDVKFDYKEPDYLPERLEEILPTIKKMWEGQYGGLPPAIRNAMILRAIDNEDKGLSRDLSSISTEYAARGFTAPPGMMISRIDTARREAAGRRHEAVRDLNIRFSEIDIENIRFGVEQYVAAENMYFNIHSNMAQRAFEVAKATVEMAVQVFNVKVMYFNALLQRADTAVRVFEVKVRAALAQLEIDRMELEKAIAMGNINDQKIRIFTARLEAVRTEVEVYKTKAQLLDIKAGLNRNLVEMYKAEITAYGELINAEKSKVELYEARVRGEAAKGQIIEAEARAYSATISGKVAKADIGFKKVDAVLKENENSIRLFAEEVRSTQTLLNAQVAAMEVKVKGRQIDTEKFKAELDAKQAAAQMSTVVYESESRVELAHFQAVARRLELIMELSSKNMALMQESYKAIGQVSATLAASAMSGINVGSHLNGQVGVDAGGRYAFNYSANTNV